LWYLALSSFNGAFGRKVTDAFPSNHFYSRDSLKIGQVHKQAADLFGEQLIQLQNLY
jgi:hypothetical protein